MSEPIANVAPAPPTSMITLKGDLSGAAMKRAVKRAAGLGVPDLRAIERKGERAVAWMAPDELMLFVPRGEVAAALAAARKGLGPGHGLAADVSDARVLFTVSGSDARDVLAKLTPADMSALRPGEMRRTRLSQVPAAIWQSGEGEFSVMVFRSVAAYAQKLLEAASAPGSAVGFHRADP